MLLVNDYNSLPQQVEENRRKIQKLEEKGVLKTKTFTISPSDWSLDGNMWKCDKNIEDMTTDSPNWVGLNTEEVDFPIIDAFLKINQCDSADGEIRLYCWTRKPAIDIPIIVYYN